MPVGFKSNEPSTSSRPHHFHQGHFPHSRRPTTLTPPHKASLFLLKPNPAATFTTLPLSNSTSPLTNHRTRHPCCCCRFMPPHSRLYGHNQLSNDQNGVGGDEGFLGTFPRLVSCILLLVLPAGSWWNLDESEGVVNGGGGGGGEGESVTVQCVLRRVWELLGNDRWIIFVAFGSLAIAALAEITMPRVLAASIFAAERGGHMVFYRNAQLLAVLCFISGISSGVRSGCFAIANVILFKHIRETLYSTLMFQDITFFDEEVGGLTSRLGADCQRLSNVIGNDFNLIIRNALQGTGALISSLSLSWPLALSSLAVCLMLARIFLVYGWFQRRASKLTWDFTACANVAAEETLSLIRTVRVYGTEREELGRYEDSLQRLAFVSL